MFTEYTAAPFSTVCSTGSKVALIRGPKVTPHHPSGSLGASPHSFSTDATSRNWHLDGELTKHNTYLPMVCVQSGAR